MTTWCFFLAATRHSISSCLLRRIQIFLCVLILGFRYFWIFLIGLLVMGGMCEVQVIFSSMLFGILPKREIALGGGETQCVCIKKRKLFF